MTRAVAAATLLVALLAAGNWLNPVKTGLTGTEYKAGSLLAMHDGQYAFGTISDDESSLYIDGQLVVDNSGRREGPRGATGLATLTRGVHAIHVRYAREGRPFHVELLWARAGQPLERMPAWALTPRRVSFWALAASAGLRRALAAAEWIWIAALTLSALMLAWAGVQRIHRWLERDGVWPAMRCVLAVSLILNGAAIWWGLPDGSWAPDEVSPVLVMDGVARRFAHGWFDRYPPFHFYVLTLAFSPMMVLEWLGQIDLRASTPYAVLTLISRLVSLAAAAGTLLATYACGAQTFGKRAGTFAASTLALVPPFVYYAKTANLDVPYLFWFALSLVFYLRFLQRPSRRDLLAFAAFGTIAICTKDQAYGLYLLTPLPIVFRLWRANRDAGVPHPFVRAVFSPALGWAAALAIGVFIASHNLPFNISGFVEHVRYITGGGSETYRDFESTLAGRLALLSLSADLVRAALGWPLLIAGAGGVILSLIDPAQRRLAVWLAIPVVSYYLGFINVVLYNYDRFMLPVCLVLALFAGLAWDRWLPASGRGRSGRAAVAGVAFGCSLLYAATVDLVMLRDSRYAVERWLASHTGPGGVIGYVFPPQYYPRLDRYSNKEITSIAQLREQQPAFFVLNEDYGRAEPPDSEIGRLIAALQNGNSGYKLVFRYREPAPWPWLPGAPRDLVGERKEQRITSVLRQIDPWYEVFKKTP